MNIKSKIARLEKQFVLSEPDYSEELKRAFAGWTKEDLATYVMTGVKPENKPINMNEIYKIPSNITSEEFKTWDEQDKMYYILTGEKPKESRL